VRQALAFLEGLSPVEVDPPRPSPPPPPPPPPPRRRQRNWWLPLALVAPLAVLIAVALVLRPGSRPPIAPTAEPLPAPTSGPVAREPPPAALSTREPPIATTATCRSR
jgi:protein TonB